MEREVTELKVTSSDVMFWKLCYLSNTRSLVLIPNHALKTSSETQDTDSMVLPHFGAVLWGAPIVFYPESGLGVCQPNPSRHWWKPHKQEHITGPNWRMYPKKPNSKAQPIWDQAVAASVPRSWEKFGKELRTPYGKHGREQALPAQTL